MVRGGGLLQLAHRTVAHRSSHCCRRSGAPAHSDRMGSRAAGAGSPTRPEPARGGPHGSDLNQTKPVHMYPRPHAREVGHERQVWEWTRGEKSHLLLSLRHDWWVYSRYVVGWNGADYKNRASGFGWWSSPSLAPLVLVADFCLLCSDLAAARIGGAGRRIDRRRLLKATDSAQPVDDPCRPRRSDDGHAYKPVALLMSDLGVTKSHSRPHVADDNPYSDAAPRARTTLRTPQVCAFLS